MGEKNCWWYRKEGALIRETGEKERESNRRVQGFAQEKHFSKTIYGENERG